MRMVSKKKREITLFNNITWEDTENVDDDINDATTDANICQTYKLAMNRISRMVSRKFG